MNSATREALDGGVAALLRLLDLAADKGADLLPSERKQLGVILAPVDQQVAQLSGLLELGSQRAPARGKVIPRPAGASPTLAEPSGLRDAALALRDVAMAVRDVADAIREVAAGARAAEPAPPATAPSTAAEPLRSVTGLAVRTGEAAKALGLSVMQLQTEIRRQGGPAVGVRIGPWEVVTVTTGPSGKRNMRWQRVGGAGQTAGGDSDAGATEPQGRSS